MSGSFFRCDVSFGIMVTYFLHTPFVLAIERIYAFAYFDVFTQKNSGK